MENEVEATMMSWLYWFHIGIMEYQLEASIILDTIANSTHGLRLRPRLGYRNEITRLKQHQEYCNSWF